MTSRILLRGGCVLTLGARTPNLTRGRRPHRRGPGRRGGHRASCPRRRTGGRERHDRHARVRRHTPAYLDVAVPEPRRRRGGPRPSTRARRRLRRHPDRPAGRGRGGDHHRRRLVGQLPRHAGRRAPGARRLRAAHGVRARRPTRGRAMHGEPRRGARPRLTEAAGTVDHRSPSAPARSGEPRSTGSPRDWALARELGPAHPRPRRRLERPAGDLAARSPRAHGRGRHARPLPGLDDADLDAIAASGAAVSLAPFSEMAGGLGIAADPAADRPERPAGSGHRRRTRRRRATCSPRCGRRSRCSTRRSSSSSSPGRPASLD